MAEVLATYSYTLINNGTAYSIACTNKSMCTKAIIPSEYNGKPVTLIDSFAFRNSYLLSKVFIPHTITEIYSDAFENCWKLKSVMVGPNVITISGEVFAGSRALESIIFLNQTPATLGSRVFPSTANNLKIYVPQASLNAYKQATNWRNYADKIVTRSPEFFNFANYSMQDKAHIDSKLSEVYNDLESRVENIYF